MKNVEYMLVLWGLRRHIIGLIEKHCGRYRKFMMWVVLRLYVNILACVTVKGGERECSWTDRGVGKGSILSTWLFSVYIDAVIKIGRRRVKIAWTSVCRFLCFVG